ncbi:MAG: TRIC cation channel family protein [Desulfovibrionaceae bacterium]
MQYSIFSMMDIGVCAVLGFAAAYRATRYGHHFTGALVLGVVVALVSPLLRDILLAFGDLVALSHGAYAAAALCGAWVGRLAATRAPARWQLFVWAEALSLGWAVAVGAAKAAVLGLGPVGCIIVAVLTAIVGGTLRDLCLGDTPLALEMDFYVTAAAIGAMVLLATRVTVLPLEAGVTLGALTATLLCVMGNERRLKRGGGEGL